MKVTNIRRLSDGSYRVEVDTVNFHTKLRMEEVIWGTVHFWSTVFGMLEQKQELKEIMVADYLTSVYVEEGGCTYRIYPDSVAEVAYVRVMTRLNKEAEQARLNRN